MAKFKALYKEKDGYAKMTIYKDVAGEFGTKVAEISEEPSGFARRERIDFLLSSLLNSMMDNRKIGMLFTDAEFEILYKDSYTEELVVFKTRKESLIRGFGSFQATLF